jgi:asparagine synthase (glutamine-hydrolysing)
MPAVACNNPRLQGRDPEVDDARMCGFVAILATDGAVPDRVALDAATDAIAHRGPDDAAAHSDGPFAVGFRRLAIFDLSDAARQPMASADGRHVIVFNGAIYNWVELRADLTARGHAFVTHGDTEVLLAAWREWGPDCLRRLNGMFAFLVWDRLERKLCGARDRFGVKPLYWSQDPAGLRVASEPKALRATTAVAPTVDWDTLADFAANDRLEARDETFFAGIRRVPAGTWFSADPHGRVEWHRWWSLDEAVAARDPCADPVAEFADTFEDAVRIRMRGDVKVGVLLSGGLDSTSIICAMARERAGANAGRMPEAFGYPSPDPIHDESDCVDATLAWTGASFTTVAPDPVELWDALPRHLWQHDEPVYSITSLVAEQLVRAARRSGVKVLLNGQGADEVLAGYPMYFAVHWSELLRRGRLSRFFRDSRAMRAAQPALARTLARQAFTDALRRGVRAIPGVAGLAAARPRSAPPNDWLAPELRARAERLRPRPHDSLASALRDSLERANLPIYLRQEDRNAMAHGVEARLPFLDHRLVTLAFSLGPEWKLASPVGKRLLRDAMRGRIPELVRTRVRKLGFPTPVDAWFRGPLYAPMRDLLASGAVRESGLWNMAIVDAALEAHRSGRANCGSRLFDVAQTALWLQAVAGSVRR